MSELQNTSAAAPASPAAQAGQETAGGAGQPPVKPVLRPGAAKRANASVMGMFIALALSIGTFLPIVLMNPSPKSDGYRPDINVSEIARYAADVAGFTPATPATGDTFRPNYARWESGTGSGVPTWEVGYLTPKESFIGLVQTRQPNPTWLLQQVKSSPVTGTRNAGGRNWELRDSGKGEKSMVLVDRGTTVILTGTAQLDEFSVLAAAVVASLDSATPASAATASDVPASDSAGPSAGSTPESTPGATISPSADPSP